MSNEKWTPGPWKVTHEAGDFYENVGVSMDSHQKNPNHFRTAHLWHSECEDDCEETVANARLIAAAPELYESLDKLLHQLSINDDEGLFEHADMVIDARAVLAKARGE